ncbi:alginate export family protein [Geobacter sp.]|uniref:alginate export family protein n=1 Tax=Geobacter sp. TaxID=46610 RepID=UPI002615E1FD|nr:alginate export family protein [Geobacter sp.]
MNKALFLLSLVVCTLCWNPVFAADDGEQIPEQVTMSHWSCKQIAELARKYDAEKKLPDTVEVEGKPISRAELAKYLLYVMDKVVKKCDLEGKEAVSREDLDRIATLHEALKDELVKYEGYLTRRKAIEAVLARPEVPLFEYKVGANGFLRGEGVGNFRLPDFSYAPGHNEGRFLYRVKPYLYWHPTDWLDIHAEGQGYGFTGGSQYEGKVSLYQGFAEVKCPKVEGYSLKAGRQELVYGSAFMLGSDTFYKGLSYDALRLRVTPVRPLTIDLFGGWYATPWSGGLKGSLAGGYATWTFAEGSSLDAYAFRDSGSADRHAGEHRNSFGLRGVAKLGPARLEVEPVWQSGRLFNGVDATDSIGAWGGHADLTADAVIAGVTNHFLAGAAYGSGSRDAATGGSARKEFLNQANDTSLTGDMSVIGDISGLTLTDAAGTEHRASGLQIYTFGWGIDLAKDLTFSATGRYFLANYAEGGFSRRLGLETDFTVIYAVSDNLSVIAGYDRFFTGGFFRDATGSGRDIHYGYLMLQFDLSHERPKLATRQK